MLVFTCLKSSKISTRLSIVYGFLTLWGKGKGIGHGGSFSPLDIFSSQYSIIDSTIGLCTLDAMILSITLAFLGVVIT